MNKTAIFIAFRYFWNLKKKKSNTDYFITLLSKTTLIGVGMSITAFLLILSFFNGMESLTQEQYKEGYPDIIIYPKKGKFFKNKKTILTKLSQLPNIRHLFQICSDKALLHYQNTQMIIEVKGVSKGFINYYKKMDTPQKKHIPVSDIEENTSQAFVDSQLAFQISLQTHIGGEPLQFWYPQIQKGKKPSLTRHPFIKKFIQAKASISLPEKEFNEPTVWVPLSFAQKLFGETEKLTHIEMISTKNIDELQKEVKHLMGDEFHVKNKYEQQGHIYQTIQIEKFFAYLILSFLLFIASLNTLFLLSMLALSKAKNITTLYHIGGSRKFIQNIFILTGLFSTFTGVLLGLLTSLIIYFLQRKIGFITFEQAGIHYPYPMNMDPFDVFMVLMTALLISLLVSWLPSYRVAKMFMK